MRSICLSVCLLLAPSLFGQTQVSEPAHISSDEALDRAQQNNVLTFNGSPFHAVLQINPENEDPTFKGRMELF
jgi:hypothetical protein